MLQIKSKQSIVFLMFSVKYLIYFSRQLLYNGHMKRILLTIEYDGANYSGWQKQPNVKTIQGEIEHAIETSIGQTVEVFGSGRTDAGVHALAQKAHFDLNVPVPVSKLPDILNNVLPPDIAIKDAQQVPDDFHARFSQKKKVYRYEIYNSPNKNAFLANRAAQIKQQLDVVCMQDIAQYLVGEHDFRGFCSAQTCTENFIRTIFSIDVARDGDFIKIDVCGNGFLYNMVRIIVGTLVDFSLGKLTKDDVLLALKTGDRARAGQTMPPQGLYLKDAIYQI